MFFCFLEKEFVVYLCGGGIIMNEFEIYSNLSKAFARHQLVEKFCFELQVGKLLFDEELDLFMLINDSHSTFVFSDEEYREAYEESKKILKEIL